MKKIFITCLVLLCVNLVHAGTSSVFFIVASNEGPQVAATIRQQADFIAAPIYLRSDKSDPTERFAAVGNAKAYLISVVTKQKGWIIYEGPVSLSGNTNSKLSSLSYSSQAQTELTILVPITEKSDAFATAGEVVHFITQQTFPEKVDARTGDILLAVREPQQYRSQLLKLIAEEAAKTRESLASGAQMLISGLENPVSVRQLNDHEVELFINYRLAIEKK